MNLIDKNKNGGFIGFLYNSVVKLRLLCSFRRIAHKTMHKSFVLIIYSVDDSTTT